MHERKPATIKQNEQLPVFFSRFPSTLLLHVTIIIVLIFSAFQPALYNEFVNWDDLQNLVQNDAYRGFTAEHLRWMFTTTYGGHYQPLSWLSFAMDYSIWGLHPAGFHLTNILLHVLTCIAFYFVARRFFVLLFENSSSGVILFGSLLATLLFAVHPLRVESVAWATERRDVLSGVFLMLTVLCYLNASAQTRKSKLFYYLPLAIMFYTLSLLSKAAGITLPVVLLILDVYPLRRIARSNLPKLSSQASLPSILIEKSFFLIPAVVIAWIAVSAQSQTGALWAFDAHPLDLRIAQAFYGILFYPITTLWPANLIPLYEQRPDAHAYEMIYIASAACVTGLTVLFWIWRRRYPSLLTCWAIYIVVLSPMLGIAQSGPQIVADRYSYLSCLPWAMLCGGLFIKLATRYQKKAAKLCVITIFSIVIVFVLVFLTRSQTKIWRNSYTLWTSNIERAPNTPTAHTNLAVILNQRQEYRRAIKHSLEALKRLPNNRHAHITLAHASAAIEDFKTADEHYETALDITHTLGKTEPEVLTQAIYVKARLGMDNEAWLLFQQIQEHERYRVTNNVIRAAESMAAGMAERGDFDQAVKLLEETIQFNPGVISAPIQSRIEIQISRYKAGKTLRQ